MSPSFAEALERVRQNVFHLKRFSEDLKGNEKIVLAAVQHGFPLRDVSEDLKHVQCSRMSLLVATVVAVG